jgi:hypothetical protein
MNLIMELFPMSNISAKFAFALLVVFASLAASFARHGGLATTRNIDSSGPGKCFQGSHVTAAERNRAEFVSRGRLPGPTDQHRWAGSLSDPTMGRDLTNTTRKTRRREPAGDHAMGV